MKFEFEDISLVSSLESELDYVLSLERDFDNCRFITPWPLQTHQSALANPDLFHAVIFKDGSRVGFLILAGLENTNRSIEFRRIVIGKKGFGLGRQTLRAVKSFCFQSQDSHRLWLDVKPFNYRAKHLYLSEGFTEEGTLRDCIKTDEGYESLIVLSMLETEYTQEVF